MPSSLVSDPADWQLVEPAFSACPAYAATLGDEVADLAVLASYPPDPEQRLCLDMIFAVDERGLSAASEFAVVCSRQNLKTGALKQAALGWLFLTDQQLVVWSAQQADVAAQAFSDPFGTGLKQLIDGCSYLSRRVRRMRDSSQERSIELMPPGGKIIFKTRTPGNGPGLSADKTVLDEGYAVRKAHMAGLVPAMSARPDPQLVWGSSAGHAESEMLRAVRDRGRSSNPGRLAYLEWCARFLHCELEKCDHEPGTPGCAFDRFESVQASNPLLGRRRANGTGLTWEYVQAERATMPIAEYGRERLGRWDEPGAEEIFGAGKWNDCAGEKPDGVRLEAVGLAVAVDQSAASIVGAGRDGRRTVVKPLFHGPDVAGVVAAAAVLHQRGIPVVIDEGGPGAFLIPALKAAGVRPVPGRRQGLVEVGTREYLDACAGILRLVRDRDLLHEDYPELNLAVNGAVPRKVGDRWAWGRRSSSSVITPVEGMTLAAWQVNRPTEIAAPGLLPQSLPDEDAARPDRELSIADAGF